MATKATRPANKRAHELYKIRNSVEKNKIERLTRHCKKYPKDLQSQVQLALIKDKGYNYSRGKPLNPGSNPTNVKPGRHVPYVYFGSLSFPKTAGEQLSILLGIPLPKQSIKRTKPKITRKPRKRFNA
jgi:hypothetical protein